MKSEIIEKTYKSVSYQLVFQILQQGSAFILSIILARLLTPVEFGVIALANLVIHYANNFTDLGFTNALVQNKKIEKIHINSVFTIDFVISFILASLTFFNAERIAAFFNNAQLIDVLKWMSLYFLITAIYYIPRAVLRRTIDFKFISITEYSQSILSYSITITLAYLGFSYWSIVYPNLGLTLIIAIIYCYRAGWMPKLKFDHSQMSDVYSFGVWSFIRSQMELLVSKIDYFFIGKYLPVKDLGVYEKSFEITDRAITGLSAPVNGVFFSSFSRLQDDKDTQREIFADAIKILTVLILPVILGLLAVSNYFVHALLGDNWHNAVLPMQLLAFATLFRITGGLVASLNIANGNFKIQTYFEMISTAVLIILCFFLVQYGIEAVAIAVIMRAFTSFLLGLILLKKNINVGIIFLLKTTALPWLNSLLMFTIVLLCAHYVLTDIYAISHFLGLFVIGVAVYAPLTFLLVKKGKLKININDIKNFST